MRRFGWSGLVVCTAVGYACSFPEYQIGADGPAGGTTAAHSVGASAGAFAGSSSPSGNSGSGGTPQGGSSTGHGGNPDPEPQAGAGQGVGGSSEPLEPGVLVGVYHLISAQSGKCLDASGPTTPDGHETIQQLECHPEGLQSLTLSESSAGYYTLEVTGTGECVDVAGGSSTTGAAIVRTPCSVSESQQWLPVTQDDNLLFFVNRQSSKCLDVPGGTLEDTPLQQYVCNTTDSQRWRIATLTSAALPLVVDDFFVSTTWEGNGRVPASVTSETDPTQACDGNRPPGARGRCHTIVIETFPGGATYTGASFLNPHGNWGSSPGTWIAPGAARIRFQARGKTGGETLQFEAGGITGNDWEDGFLRVSQHIDLTTEWQSYELDLNGADYSGGVIAAFGWSFEVAHNSAPATFYIDDIVWE